MDFQSIGRRFRRFPWIKQRDSMQCGVACLTMVCRHYGWACTLSQIEELCHATTEGVSLRGMSQAASELGFGTASVRLSPDELSQSPLPAILHWNQNHFVVIYRINRRGIHDADIGLIWLILLGELMIVTGRTATDFIRRWLLLHISMRINIS